MFVVDLTDIVLIIKYLLMVNEIRFSNAETLILGGVQSVTNEFRTTSFA